MNFSEVNRFIIFLYATHVKLESSNRTELAYPSNVFFFYPFSLPSARRLITYSHICVTLKSVRSMAGHIYIRECINQVSAHKTQSYEYVRKFFLCPRLQLTNPSSLAHTLKSFLLDARLNYFCFSIHIVLGKLKSRPSITCIRWFFFVLSVFLQITSCNLSLSLLFILTS